MYSRCAVAKAPGAGIVAGILGLLLRHGDGVVLTDDVLAVLLVVAAAGFRQIDRLVGSAGQETQNQHHQRCRSGQADAAPQGYAPGSAAAVIPQEKENKNEEQNY